MGFELTQVGCLLFLLGPWFCLIKRLLKPSHRHHSRGDPDCAESGISGAHCPVKGGVTWVGLHV